MKKQINEIKRMQELAGVVNEEQDFSNMSKEELLDLFIEVITNHYRGPGWKGVKYSESLPSFKNIKSALLNRMQ
jgi:hypothetical protein